jgi:murein DD-endopeptidase MepM/ murein hydrolase activator NlpD
VIIGVAVVFLTAVGELIIIWSVNQRAAEVPNLRRRILELEASEQRVAELGKELSDLQTFEKQLRMVLSTSGPDTFTRTPWMQSSSIGLNEAYSDDASMHYDESSTVVFSLPAVIGSQESSDLPTYPPVRGYITRKYSAAGPFRYTSHLGLDLAAREGTPILAAANGVVLFSGWTFPYGKLLLILHPSGFATLYGHNQALLVSAGENVIQGQPVGLLGSSGRSTAPHLHFEIWKGDRPIDPLTFLKPE